ncbi:multidrug effflux MFS transporter [Flavobacterium sp. JP2137]|uniref:multidrug effflux MFS transporter n=1 Tax=Flavobacterium sp. JP2137 TaxID=3414510 RepID=UPI003D2FBE87
MNALTPKHWLLVFVLASLTALGPLSIDMYLPAFQTIATDLNTPISHVQISLSCFLGGLAVGQLFWGPLSDTYGSKKPILISLCLFMVASYLCTAVDQIEYLWGLRFLQALGSSGGLVIARAIVNKRFSREQTLKIYSILALIGGIAPIVGPIVGNEILKHFHWHALFVAMLLFGLIGFSMTALFLKESDEESISTAPKSANFSVYLALFKNRQFLIYTIIGSLSFSSLMLYISNAPLLIMEEGGLSGDAFSLVFGLNSIGLMLGSFLTSTVLQKHLTPRRILFIATGIQLIASALLLVLLTQSFSIYAQLIALFFFVLPLGMLFPTATTLALRPFKAHSGTASALFGASQLAFTFLVSLVVNHLSNGSMLIMALALLSCALLSFCANVFAPKSA